MAEMIVYGIVLGSIISLGAIGLTRWKINPFKNHIRNLEAKTR